MPLHPKIRAMLAAQRAAGLPHLHELSVERAREDMRSSVTAISGPPVPVGHVYDRSIPGPAGPIAVRFYYPQAEGPLPALVYFHGGGFVIGDLDTHDPVARR